MDFEGSNVFIVEQNPSTARSINYVPESMSHPAKMPPDLVRRLLKVYSQPGEIILDPMAGIGTTIIEAILLDRNAMSDMYSALLMMAYAQIVLETKKMRKTTT